MTFRCRARLLASLAVLATLADVHAQGTRRDPRTARLDSLIDSYARLGQLSGSVLVVERGHVLLRRGVGMSDRELGVPARPDHRYVIGSITKAFTAALVLRQVDRGRIALDSPVVRYWPEFPEPLDSAGAAPGARITIRHLLTHRSGLKHWGAVAGFLDGPARMRHDQKDLVATYAAKGLSFSPGTREEYSSIGYLALGIVLERVTGKPLAELLRTELFEPLGMSSSSLDDRTTVLPGRARPYRYNFLGARYDNAEYRDPSTTWSTGGIVTTLDDLGRWSEALGTGSVLSDSLRALVFDRTEGDAWFGWRIDTLATGDRAFWHTGLETGWASQIMRVPTRGWTVVVLGNVRDLDTAAITQRILTILRGGRAEAPRRSVAKAIYETAAAHGGDSAAARFRSIVREPADYDTTRSQALIAAIELRSDGACERAAPVYEAWLEAFPETRGRVTALIGAADCRLLLGHREAARRLIDRLAVVDSTNANLAALRRRLSAR
jgi:CubicO group peptidase (beta-lactamase class C family)